MGANLIGYHLFIPEKKAPKIFKSCIKELRKIIPITKSQTELFLKDMDPDKIMKNAGQYGVDIQYYMEIQLGRLTNKDILEQIQNDLEELEKKWPKFFKYSDVNVHELHINNVKVLACYTGDKSWGDAPDGEGYRTADLLYRFDIDRKFYDAVPWNSKRR